jgi:hypothetical protein
MNTWSKPIETTPSFGLGNTIKEWYVKHIGSGGNNIAEKIDLKGVPRDRDMYLTTKKDRATM